MDNSHVKPYIQLSGELFEAVQKQRIYPDSKHFVDMAPINEPETILKHYREEKEKPGFSLKEFVETWFDQPESPGENVVIEEKESCREHIQALWPMLFRSADARKNRHSSLLPLPEPYVVPGGRFREIYYWDSYFTAQGLKADGHNEMILAMAENFRHLIETVGHIPNGNRAYYLSRSQPPFFTPMIDLVVSIYGTEKISEFLPAVEKEYRFWMDEIGEPGRRAIAFKTEGGDEITLNRYWDDHPAPREESWFEDVEIAESIPETEREHFYRNIRAACESGWDFTSRWFADEKNLSTIQTTDILPVDLNTLLWYMEKKLAEWHFHQKNTDLSNHFAGAADQRSWAIHELMWNHDQGCFFDYNFRKRSQTTAWSLAAVYPLYFGLATEEEAASLAGVLNDKFLKGGGLITTTNETGEQWDAPNGWAPLQWLAIRGLQRYGHNELAGTITRRWLDLNEHVYRGTGKMVEKYNVADLTKEGGGGEYPLQDGFGWSNGVYSALDAGYG
jgi:alpha,alpha-trehalase